MIDFNIDHDCTARCITNGFVIVSDDKEATAFHEAGHAIVGAICGKPPLYVTIIAAGGASGKTQFPDDDAPRDFKRVLNHSPEKRLYIETRILTVMAGTIAHDLHCHGRVHDAGDEYDDRRAREIIEYCAGWACDDRDGYCQQLQERARSLLRANWQWVDAVARALFERKTIQGEEVMELRSSE